MIDDLEWKQPVVHVFEYESKEEEWSHLLEQDSEPHNSLNLH